MIRLKKTSNYRIKSTKQFLWVPSFCCYNTHCKIGFVHLLTYVKVRTTTKAIKRNTFNKETILKVVNLQKIC